MAARRTKLDGVMLTPGAGSGREHHTLVAIENALAPLPVARVDFPYRRAGRRAPDRQPVLLQCVRDEVAAWTATHTEVVPGASHFFVGRTDRVVELALGYVSSVGSAR